MHQITIVDFTPGREHVDPGRGKAQGKKGMPRLRWVKQLSATDQIVEWLKPTNKPRWMSKEQFARLPASIEVCELRYTIHQKGFRPDVITLVTTLLESERYTLSDLSEQFRERWAIETNFGHLKTTMKMDVLKCKTVEGVLRELYALFSLQYGP